MALLGSYKEKDNSWENDNFVNYSINRKPKARPSESEENIEMAPFGVKREEFETIRSNVYYQIRAGLKERLRRRIIEENSIPIKNSEKGTIEKDFPGQMPESKNDLLKREVLLKLRERMRNRIVEYNRKKIETEAFELLDRNTSNEMDLNDSSIRRDAFKSFSQDLDNQNCLETSGGFSTIEIKAQDFRIHGYINKQSNKRALSEHIRSSVSKEELKNIRIAIRKQLYDEILLQVSEELRSILDQKIEEILGNNQNKIPLKKIRSRDVSRNSEYERICAILEAARAAALDNETMHMFSNMVLGTKEGMKILVDYRKKSQMNTTKLASLIEGVSRCFDCGENQISSYISNHLS